MNFMRQAAQLNVDKIVAESFLECVLEMLGEISVHRNGPLPLMGKENVSREAAALPKSGIVSGQNCATA